MSGPERRAHARVAVPLRAKVEAGGKSIEVALRDISKGGAFLYVDRAPANAGEIVKLTVWFPDETTSIALRAEIVRTVPATPAEGGGILGVGVRFEAPTRIEVEGLERLLTAVLRGAGGDKRASPRISAFLRVRCRTEEMSDAVMRDIGRGGLAMATDRPLGVGDHVEVQVAAPNSAPTSLRGHVVRAEPPAPGSLLRVVGVQFDELSDRSRADLEALLDALARA